MPNILVTGVATLDIINLVTEYPSEDSEVRATRQRRQTGGNATNMAIVLSQLGNHCALLAQLADDEQGEYIRHQLDSRNISLHLCPVQEGGATPTSYIALSEHNGSRTIIHHRQLDELDPHYVCKLDFSPYDWLHFEARDCTRQVDILQYARRFNKPVSLELEKPREGIEALPAFADLLLLSRPYAESQGFSSAELCVTEYAQRYPDKVISCTWGASGAWLYHNGTIRHQAATPLASTLETIGAGDTYNAALISALAQGQPPETALSHACELAARKCSQHGFDKLTL